MSNFNLLFSPLRLGSLNLANRIVFSAHLTNYAVDGLPSDKHVDYYEARARGGAGLIITEEHSVHPTDWPYEKMIHGFKPEAVKGYRAITEAVHRYPTSIFAQINHNGPQASSMYSRLPVLGPSQVPDPLFREVPKEATHADLREVIGGYQQVAARAIDGGFDGIELQCSHSSIVRAFLSPSSNHRQDGYGGDLAGRSRLMREIVAGVRASIGPDPVLGVRLSGDEMIEDGTRLDEAVELARMLEAGGGVDYINTSIGVATASLYTIEASMSFKPGYALFIASAIRKAVNLPVIGVGRIKDPLQAEKALAAGHCDLIGMVRAQIADPDLAIKARHGRTRDIRLCLSCNQECVGRVGMNRTLGCIENPRAGKEGDTLAVHTAQRRPKVAVIGAGPGGCQAAISLARAGVDVALVEAQDHLGGQLALADRAPSRAEITDLIRNQRNELELLGIEPLFGQRVLPEEIQALGAHAVVIATGSRETAPYWISEEPEHRGMRITSVRRLFEGAVSVEPGTVALVYDEVGFHQASSAAELLWAAGAKVHFVTPLLVPGQDLGITLDYETFRMRAAAQEVEFHTALVATSAGGTSVSFMNHLSGQVSEIGADLLVLSLHGTPDNELFSAARQQGIPAIRLGDALSPRRAHAAVIEGDRAPGVILRMLEGSIK